jgi:hypothetical protein
MGPDAVSRDRRLLFPAGLATVHIDREQDAGEYWEPNVWMIHPLATGRHNDVA